MTRSARRFAAFLLVTGLAAAIAAPAAPTATGVKMGVSKLRPFPDSVITGTSFKLSGTVRNSGTKSRGARVEVFLEGGAEIGREHIGKVRAKRKRRFSLKATLPADLPAGQYAVRACVPRKGTSGKAKCRSRDGLTVVGPAGAAPQLRAPGDGP
jgi:hypothetical protein